MPIDPPFIEKPYQRVGVEPEVPMQDMEIVEPPAPAPAPVVVRTPPPAPKPAPKPRKPIKRAAPPKPAPPEEPTLSPADLEYKANAVKQYLASLNTTERRQVLNDLRKS
jgi:hypothetical protein